MTINHDMLWKEPMRNIFKKLSRKRYRFQATSAFSQLIVRYAFFRFDRESGNGSLLVLIVNSAQEYMVMLQFKS